jgi:23S rRNA (adenine2030-N6)-methyltransferase
LLSYQHLYHAGNLADVHKHAVLAWMLDYLIRKDKPLSYIETHAGRGLYDLAAPEAAKTGEAARGIARALGWFAPDHPYAVALAQVRTRHGPDAYPGSPMLAALALRPGDSLHLAELHPREHAALADAMLFSQAICHRQDGLALALALTPPTPRRGLMLVDPSYEVQSDYEALPKLFANVARKWNVGILMLWYPVLAGAEQAEVLAGMLAALTAAHPGAINHQVRFAPARPGHGMVGSGLFVINPPWGLADELAQLTRAFKAAL